MVAPLRGIRSSSVVGQPLAALRWFHRYRPDVRREHPDGTAVVRMTTAPPAAEARSPGARAVGRASGAEGAAALDEDRVAPAAGRRAVGHECDAIAGADLPEARVLVEGEAAG